ncbi:DUF3967 domain-containing protein [Bacillus pseudomycoides]|uniref:DUF3967 domain-containing protein n=1 Tax=Bacillus TaxID=1386 RepID=UPI002248FC72|nr:MULTISPECIES: DUF3967 domain-containing protein [Bacillus]MCX2829668.1 DUF3967 domain-containing protein [Bacillus sp. DHT2]MDR4919164.1 DUF3967 domain-containing protein [Bacillus pseudomycoides]
MDKSENLGKEKPGYIAMTVKEVALCVDESPNVIRNWMKELRTYIPLEKNESGYNVFNKKALEQMKIVKQLHREQNYSIKQIEHYFATGGESIKPVPSKEVGEILAEELKALKNEVSRLREYSEKQEEFNKLLIEQLQKQQDYIDNKLENRDQKLLETIREVQETKLLTASTEQKGFFARLFRK